MFARALLIGLAIISSPASAKDVRQPTAKELEEAIRTDQAGFGAFLELQGEGAFPNTSDNIDTIRRHECRQQKLPMRFKCRVTYRTTSGRTKTFRGLVVEKTETGWMVIGPDTQN